MPSLFRRRQVWLPTFWGVLLLCIVVAALAILAARHVGGYLAASDRAVGRDGKGARTLVVEGWLDEDELDDAIAVVARGRYERVVTSGSPIESWREGVAWPTFAERAADYLRRHGLADAGGGAVPAPASAQDRTFLSAVVVRDWARRLEPPLDALDLFSAGVHARRSRLAYRIAFGARRRGRRARGGGRAATTSSAGGRPATARSRCWTRLLGLAWTKCCFLAPAPGSHEERWAVPKSPA